MARTPSKIMTIADKKAAQANLKIAIKQQADLAKTISADVKVATAALATAKKNADTQAKDAAKQAAVIAKANDIALKAAQKTYDAAVTLANKKADAAAKGAAKLNDQMAALDTVVAVKDAPAPKVAKAATAKSVADATVSA